MAERGGQPGNNNAAKNRPWREAVSRALAKKSRVDQIEALDAIAEKVVDAALAGPSYEKGDPWLHAVNELADRLDGKPAQQLIHSGDEDAPLVARVTREVTK